MTLQDYTTEELRAELKRRTELAKAEAEKAKVKRCRMCNHCGCMGIKPCDTERKYEQRKAKLNKKKRR